MNKIDTIIEPYCGSFALIRKLIDMYPDKKYICNDNDEMLIRAYTALQDDDQCNELIEFYKTFEIKDKLHYDTFKKENSIKSYLFIHIIYRICYGLYDKNKHKFNDKDINRLIHFNKNYKNIEFIFGDAKNIIEKHMNNKKCFLFLDPPFFLQTNSMYKNANIDGFLDLLKNVNDFPCKMLSVGGDHCLILCFYEFYKIKIKFETTINYRGNKNKKHQNVYVSNY